MVTSYGRHNIIHLYRRVLSLDPSLLAQAIYGIPDSKNVMEFQNRCRIKSKSTAIDLLKFLNRNGIGESSCSQVYFSRIDKLNLLLFALEYGCDATLLSSKLDWRDFEAFSTIMLEQAGYACKTNITIKKPRFQIDIIAKINRTALIIDCKHWKKMSTTEGDEWANKQYVRTKWYLKTDKHIRIAIPIIVTLYEYSCHFKNKMPFVPISKFRSFLAEYTLYQDQIPQVS